MAKIISINEDVLALVAVQAAWLGQNGYEVTDRGVFNDSSGFGLEWLMDPGCTPAGSYFTAAV